MIGILKVLSFTDANLRNVTIDGLIADDLEMSYANIQDASITNSTIHSRISFNNAKGLRANFSGTYFNKQSEFEGATLHGIRVTSVAQLLVR